MTGLLLGALAAAEAPAAVPTTVPTAPEIEAPTLPAGLATGPLGTRPPPMHVVAFADRDADGSCDPVEAGFGRCVEVVDLWDPTPLWAWDSTRPEHGTTEARLRGVGRTWAQLWELLADRWPREDALLTPTLTASGYDALPLPAASWDAARPWRTDRFALPQRDWWLTASRWGFLPVEGGPPEESAAPPLLTSVRHGVPEEAPKLPATIILRGRFAARMGYGGRSHPFDVMEADTRSSGPFFEQMFPYARPSQPGADVVPPLRDFDLPESLWKGGKVPTAADLGAWARASEDAGEVASGEAGGAGGGRQPVTLEEPRAGEAAWAPARAFATQQFSEFERSLGVLLARFAMREYTDNQIRVLTALTAMREPPMRTVGAGGRTRDLVAAARGQTDADADVAAEVTRTVHALVMDRPIPYGKVAEEVAYAWIDRLWAAEPPGAAAGGFEGEWAAWLAREEQKCPRLQGVPEDMPATPHHQDILDWSAQRVAPGPARELCVAQLRESALRILFQRLPPAEQDEKHTHLLLDDVSFAVASRFDPSGAPAAPAEVEKAAAAQWAATLGNYLYTPRRIPQGLNAIDPVAICTTLDGPAALGEPSFRAVDLEVLVRAPISLADDQGNADPTAVLWEAREQSPLLFLDHPDRGEIDAQALVGLPGGTALYRVRWRVWSGWHLWWTVSPLPGGGQRMVARTAAICDDTTLVAADLAPTVLRAALLDRELRAPTTPSAAEVRAAEQAAVGAPVSRMAAGMYAPVGPIALPEGLPSGGTVEDLRVDGSRRDRKEEESPAAEISEAARYLQGLGRAALARLGQEEGGSLVTVFDLGAPRRDEPLRDHPPSTPYVRVRQPADGGLRVRTAAWALFFPSAGDPVLVLPGWLPTDSVTSLEPVPRWSVPVSTDWYLQAGLGGFPFRQTTWACPEAAGLSDNADVVPYCSDDLVVSPLYTGGLSVDAAATAVSWLGWKPRWGLEVGIESRLDTILAGQSPVGEAVPDEPGAVVGDDDLTWAVMFRPAFGAILGLRWAPGAGPLHARGENAWPWGAEGPDGRARLGRFQAGTRGLVSLGSGFNGVEMTVQGELWGAWSIRASRAANAALTPYHPQWLLGPYARFQYGLLPDPSAAEGYLLLDESWALVVGARGHLRLGQPAPDPPEGLP